MPTITKNNFKVGDLVTVRLGMTTWRSRIVEDRGPIGVNGRRIYRVEFPGGKDEPQQFIEVPAESLQPAR